MEYAKKYKWALSGFIIMVILNIALLATAWVVRYDRHHTGSKGSVPFRMQRFMERELNFSEAQKQAFDELRKEHFRESRAIFNDIKKYRRALFDELQGGEANQAQARVDSLTTLIGNAQARLDAAIYEHFMEVRNMCNEEQKQKFDRIIQKVIQRLDPRKKKG